MRSLLQRKRLLLLLVRLVCILVAGMLMFRWFENSQIYHPIRGKVGTPASLGSAWEDVRFQAADGVALHGWYFPSSSSSARSNLVILYFHGNMGHIGHRLDFCAALLSLGVNLFAIDYRGYGNSAGSPDEQGLYLDAAAAYRWLRQKGHAPENIVLLGKSLGGAVAAELAFTNNIGGLILQSTFTSIPDIGREIFPWLPVRLICSSRFDSLDKIAQIKAPVLVIHSREDSLIPFHHGERLFQRANQPKVFWEAKGNHNETYDRDPEGYLKALESFLDKIKSSSSSPPVS